MPGVRTRAEIDRIRATRIRVEAFFFKTCSGFVNLFLPGFRIRVGSTQIRTFDKKKLDPDPILKKTEPTRSETLDLTYPIALEDLQHVIATSSVQLGQ